MEAISVNHPVTVINHVINNSVNHLTNYQSANPPVNHVVNNISGQTSNLMKSTSGDQTVITVTRINELVKEIDSSVQLDDEVEEVLVSLTEDFVETLLNGACLMAKHRRVSAPEVKDVQVYLERSFNMWLPGFGTDELRPYKRAPVTEAHKQRMALIRRSLKKY